MAERKYHYKLILGQECAHCHRVVDQATIDEKIRRHHIERAENDQFLREQGRLARSFDYAEAIRLRNEEKLSYSKIAKRLETSNAAVYTMFNRLKKGEVKI